MKMRLIALSFAAVIATTLAQAPPGTGNGPSKNVTDATNKTPFWDCSVPGGNFTISLGKIASVSIHEFNITGARVTEVNVDTEGSVCARFYFIEAIKIGGALSATEIIKDRVTDVADTVADHTGTDKVWRKVQKDYPIATHAHTVEYRLQSKEELTAIHSSVKTAWMTGQGRTIKIVDEKEK
jgi:hypothetical protein